MICTDHENQISFVLITECRYKFLVFNYPNHTDGRRREYRLNSIANLRLVVETYVTTCNWRFEFLTSCAHALDRADKLPVYFWVVWVTEVQTVRYC